MLTARNPQPWERDWLAATTQLAAVTGLALGTIGDHLRILADAGLAERHRSGAHVLYHRTPGGSQLLGLPNTDRSR